MPNKSEKQIQTEIFREVGSNPDVRIFRNNCGTAWTGDVTRLQDGSLLIKNPRPLHAGLTRGSGDLIGWRRRIITQEDVGAPVAQFLSLEIKARRGRATAEQKNWASVVRQFGGMAAIVRSVDEAMAEINSDLVPF